MPIDTKKKFIFVHIPRTGGGTIETLFNLKKKQFIYGEKHKIILQHLNIPELIKCGYCNKDQVQKYFKFCFIRNPWDRLVSSYNWYMYRKHKCDFNDFIKKVEELFSKTDFSLQNMIKGMSEEWFHWRPQSYYLKYIDKIYKFENFEQSVKEICNKYNVQYYDCYNHQTRKDKNYKKYYNDFTIDIVNRLYQKDIVIGQYQWKD